MNHPPRPLPTLPRWLLTIGACLAFVAQLAVAFAPLIESDAGPSAPVHMDAAGTKVHYAHNELACAACQARSLHGTTTHHAVVLPAPGPRAVVPVTADERVVSVDVVPLHNPRAPPSVI